MKNYDDNELLYLISEGNEFAYNYLYEKYKPYIIKLSNKYLSVAKKVALDSNDLIQEGMLGLSEAIKSYSDNKETKFRTFAILCIRNQIISSITSNNRLKYKVLNESKSLDYNYEDTDTSLINYIKDNRKDPENLVILKEEEERLSNMVKDKLSDFEKQIFDLKMYGLDYNEIALILNKSYKSIGTAMNRIQNKLKNDNINID